MRPWSLVVLVCSIATPAWAGDYYVSTTGSNANSGKSLLLAWATIQKAASSVQPGDTVHVQPGVYAEAVVSKTNGTASLPIVFVSDVKWLAQIRAPAGAGKAWENAGDYVSIIGFDVTGKGNIGIWNNGSYVSIRGNHVHHVPAACNGIEGGAGIVNGIWAKPVHDSDIIGNWVHHIGAFDSTGGPSCMKVHGIYQWFKGGRIWNNIVDNNWGWGIHLWLHYYPVATPAGNTIISNNLLFGNRVGGIVVGTDDPKVTADNVRVNNNIVIDHAAPVYRAIVELPQVGYSNQYQNNLLFWNTVNGKADNTLQLIHGAESGTITADPKLVSYAVSGMGDYHLQSTSPCRDKGVSAFAPSDDCDGNSRPWPALGAWDIGPYEWRPPAPPPADGGIKDRAVVPPRDGPHSRDGLSYREGTAADRAAAPADGAGRERGGSSDHANAGPGSGSGGGCGCVLAAGGEGDVWFLLLVFLVFRPALSLAPAGRR